VAISYLTGNEQPTAERMNALWAEADSILTKALNGCSTYLLENIGASATPSSYPDSYLYRGTPFTWTTGGTHTASSTSVLYSAFETVPTHHSQSSYDTAADAATVATYSSDGYAHLAGSSTPNLINSLKVHTRTDSGTEYHIWEYDQPAPEKEWKFAVAEIILALGSGTSFAVPDSYLKYNCWRIHNLTDRTYTIYLDGFSSPTDTFTIPPYSQRCVRRIGTNDYDYSYKYFFKVLSGDPRFLAFDSFDGSIAQTMRANNITNPHYIFNLFEFVGMGNDPILNTDGISASYHQRIYFNATTQNDIGAEYATAGYFPTITDSTKIGDIVYHKGKIGYRKKNYSSSTLEQGTIDFDGWGTFNSNLNAIGAEIDWSSISNNLDTAIAKTDAFNLLEIWPLSTNVLQINDANQVLNLAASVYRLQTHFLKVPDIHKGVGYSVGVDSSGEPKSFREYHSIWESIATSGANPNVIGTGYDGRTYTVGNLKSQIADYCKVGSLYFSSPENKSVVLTSEGPKLLWRDVFGIKSPASGGDNAGHWSGFMTNHAFTLELDGSTLKLKCDQEWHIAKRLHSAGYTPGSAKGAASYLYAYLCGWPTLWKDSMFNAVSSNRRHHIDTHKFHRMHETPREVRKYETATPITAGTETFKHNDIDGDPAGVDLQLKNIGTLNTTDIAFLTNDIDAKVSKGSFSGGEINNPNYPRLVVGDVMLEAEESKTDASLNTTKTPASYNRINLVKEHYNNIAVMLKRADKIRPLCVDEIYWGNRIMRPGAGWFGEATLKVAPINLYEGFIDGDSQDALYTDLLGASKVYDYTDFADGSAIHSASSNTGTTFAGIQSERDDLEDFRWVKIEDVKAFADAEGLGFRFEELAVPCRWVTSLSQTHWLGSFADQEDFFMVPVSGESHEYKCEFQGGVKGMVAGENFGSGFDYVPLTTSSTETLGETFYREDSYNFLFPYHRLIPVFKTSLATPPGIYGYATGLVIQIIDGASGRTNTPRGKLALQPLKTVKVINPGNTSLAGGEEIDIDDSDRVETATTELESITSDKHFYYPTKPRHRYAYLLVTSAAKTHSA